MRTIPGQLPSDQVAALLAPFEEFAAFVADIATIRVVTGLTELSKEGHTIRVFNLTNTTGTGGGMLHGESGFRVFTAELPGSPRAPLRIVHRGVGSTLRHLFSKKVRIEGDASFDEAYVVLCADADGARAALPPEALAHLGHHRPDVELELRGNRFVAHRRGVADGEAQQRFIQQLSPLVPLLGRAGYRG